MLVGELVERHTGAERALGGRHALAADVADQGHDDDRVLGGVDGQVDEVLMVLLRHESRGRQRRREPVRVPLRFQHQQNLPHDGYGDVLDELPGLLIRHAGACAAIGRHLLRALDHDLHPTAHVSHFDHSLSSGARGVAPTS